MKHPRILLVLPCLLLSSCLATLNPFLIKNTGTDLNGITILSISFAQKAQQLKEEYKAVKVDQTSTK